MLDRLSMDCLASASLHITHRKNSMARCLLLLSACTWRITGLAWLLGFLSTPAHMHVLCLYEAKLRIGVMQECSMRSGGSAVSPHMDA